MQVRPTQAYLTTTYGAAALFLTNGKMPLAQSSLPIQPVAIPDRFFVNLVERLICLFISFVYHVLIWFFPSFFGIRPDARSFCLAYLAKLVPGIASNHLL